MPPSTPTPASSSPPAAPARVQAKAAFGDLVSVQRAERTGDGANDAPIQLTLIGELRELPIKPKDPGGFDADLRVSIEVRQGPQGKVINVAREGAAASHPVKLAECTRIA